MYSLSEKASADLDSILDYSIVNFGIEVMLEYHHSLEKCFTFLEKNPKTGTSVDHICSGYLRFHHRSHAIFYKKTADSILIVRLLHQSMDISRHFRM